MEKARERPPGEHDTERAQGIHADFLGEPDLEGMVGGQQERKQGSAVARVLAVEATGQGIGQAQDEHAEPEAGPCVEVL